MRSTYLFEKKHILYVRKVNIKNLYAIYSQFSMQRVVFIFSSKILFMFGYILESYILKSGIEFSLFLYFVLVCMFFIFCCVFRGSSFAAVCAPN
jgi:hypothetical protein